MHTHLVLCAFTLMLFVDANGQNRGELNQKADPEFFRSMNHYLKVNQKREISGYRVQIFNGQRSEANRWRSRAMTALPEMKSMVIFETPDYKLQVGNYRTLYEAEAALLQVRAHFPGAFVIETSIEPPALQRQEENAEPTEEQGDERDQNALDTRENAMRSQEEQDEQ